MLEKVFELILSSGDGGILHGFQLLGQISLDFVGVLGAAVLAVGGNIPSCLKCIGLIRRYSHWTLS